MRWVPRRKAALLQQIDDGAITLEEACTRHDLSPEEVTSWRTAIAQHGIAGLRVTRLQAYRETGPHRRVIKTMAAAIAFVALAGAAHAYTCPPKDYDVAELAGCAKLAGMDVNSYMTMLRAADQTPGTSRQVIHDALTRFRQNFEDAHDAALAAMPPAERQCREDSYSIEFGDAREQAFQACVAKVRAAAATYRATHGPKEIPLAHAPKEIPLR